MILVDTSVWIDHFRNENIILGKLLTGQQVLTHPFVIGELALGNLQQRELILDALQNLAQSTVASHSEVVGFIGQKSLFGLGIGYVDAHLLTSAQLTPHALLWTRDKRLLAAADRLSLTANLVH